MNKLIQQGAEAKIFLTTEDAKITKDRISKGYRHHKLDKQIRSRRTKSEAKILAKSISAGVNVPKVTHTDKDKHVIYMDYIDGDRLSETLNSYDEKKQYKIMEQIGEQAAILHKNNLIHGDLTTSNTILKSNTVYIIDFGLGFVSTKQEDKAVDIHLIKQALEAKHFQNHKDLFKQFVKGYKWKDSKEILKRLEIVERRGRYKH
jgi:Kae1-associated kinase Bud32